MPVPQQNSLFVEQASCLLLAMVQDVKLSDLAVSLSTIITYEDLLQVAPK